MCVIMLFAMIPKHFTILGALVVFLGAGCGAIAPAPITPKPQPSAATPTQPMALTSAAFESGGDIPQKYTCNGQDFSPPMTFSSVPEGTVSLALTMVDQTAPFDHWVLFNIAPTASGIIEGDIPMSSVGVNSNGGLGYTGPCPTEGKHQYLLTLIALNRAVYLPDGATREELLKDIEGKVIQQATLVGGFGGEIVPSLP